MRLGAAVQRRLTNMANFNQTVAAQSSPLTPKGPVSPKMLRDRHSVFASLQSWEANRGEIYLASIAPRHLGVVSAIASKLQQRLDIGHDICLAAARYLTDRLAGDKAYAASLKATALFLPQTASKQHSLKSGLAEVVSTQRQLSEHILDQTPKVEP
jgi:hypothetical protein